MVDIPWTQEINFASALLLHSCVTVLLKECLNLTVILHRILLRFWLLRHQPASKHDGIRIRTSVVLDACTSICSEDEDGELAELYFTNTGFILLAISLAASVAMNLLLSSTVLNTIVAVTYGVTFLASLINLSKEMTLPIAALRRAARFIWSDTPFVNFFSLIYVATVRRGQSNLRLQDYVTFRCIAVLELVFMKAKIAASKPEKQVELMRRLIASEWLVIKAFPYDRIVADRICNAEHDKMVAFTTQQRLGVMLLKTSPGFQHGCLQGRNGPARCPMPDVGRYSDEGCKDWRVYRLAEDIMAIADCPEPSPHQSAWKSFIASAHGVLLRRLGKIRVIYLVRMEKKADGPDPPWHSNMNLVTGVSKQWLDDAFQAARLGNTCIVAGTGTVAATDRHQKQPIL